jgi:UDP-glucose 4-epimerase
MHVLVLGGNGFIGSHVVDGLLAAGHRVRILDRSEDVHLGRRAGVEYVLGAFADTLLLREALADVDLVFHAISTTGPGTSNADPVADVQSNLVGSIALLEAMKGHGVRRIVFLSSGGTVYGHSEEAQIPETHRLHPICSYGIVKVAIERYLSMHARLWGLQPLILRPSNPYGPRQGHVGVQGVVGTFLARVVRGEPVEIWGDGSIVRDFVYVEDLARLCVLGAESSVCGVFNAGSGEGQSIAEVFECVARVTGTSVRPLRGPSRDLDLPRVVLDTTRARETFGWQPTVSLADGVARTHAWVQEALTT